MFNDTFWLWSVQPSLIREISIVMKLKVARVDEIVFERRDFLLHLCRLPCPQKTILRYIAITFFLASTATAFGQNDGPGPATDCDPRLRGEFAELLSQARKTSEYTILRDTFGRRYEELRGLYCTPSAVMEILTDSGWVDVAEIERGEGIVNLIGYERPYILIRLLLGRRYSAKAEIRVKDNRIGFLSIGPMK